MIPTAIRACYRHFDTALIYATQQILGISLGTEWAKVFHPPAGLGHNHLGNTIDLAKYLADPTLDMKARVLHDIERCLQELNIGYLDMMILHWPGLHDTTDAVQGHRLRMAAWSALGEMYTAGKIRAIGVSNFLIRHLEPLLQECTIKPMMNQIEVSPYITQNDVVEYCQAHGIVIQAWGAFGSGATGALEDAYLSEVAKKYGKNNGQIILRWLIQLGMTAVPKSSSFSRMQSNLNVFNFSLSQEEIAKITALNKNLSLVVTAETIA